MQSCLLGKNVRFNGKPIAVNRPYIVHVKTEYVTRVCSGCLKEDSSLDANSSVDLKACSRCHFDRYCSKNCQRKAWRYHKATCTVIARGGRPDDRLRTMSQMFQKVKETTREEEGDLCWRQFDDLPDYEMEMMDDGMVPGLYIEVSLEDYAKLYQDEPADKQEHYWRKKVCMRGDPNFLELSTSTGKLLGQGLYLSFSVLQHCCDPMAVFKCRGTTAQLWAVRKPRFPDEVVTVSRGYYSFERAKRQESLLYDRYIISCKCHWCSDDDHDRMIHSFNCSEKTCSELISMEDSACSKGHKVTRNHSETAKRDMAKCTVSINLLKDHRCTSDAVDQAIQLFLTTPLSVFNINKIQLGFELANRRPLLREHAFHILDQAVKGMCYAIPSHQRDTRMYLLLSEVLIEKHRFREARDHLERVKERYIIVYGTEDDRTVRVVDRLAFVDLCCSFEQMQQTPCFH